MAKCKQCGKKGLFLKLSFDGLCKECADINIERNRILEERRIRQLEDEEQEKKRLEMEERLRSEMQREMTELKEMNEHKPQRKISQQSKNHAEYNPSEFQFIPHTSTVKYNDSDIDTEIIKNHKKIVSSQLQYARKYHIDYVEVTGTCCCAECAKYRYRIYNVSGKDSRFPKFPEYIKKYGYHCNLRVNAFSLGIDNMRLTSGKSIYSVSELMSYSDRPFVDDREDEEIERYNRIIEKNKQEYINELNKKQAKKEYEQILKKLPDIAPKSQGGYLHMKKSNSENFRNLEEKARESGIEIKSILTDDNK